MKVTCYRFNYPESANAELSFTIAGWYAEILCVMFTFCYSLNSLQAQKYSI